MARKGASEEHIITALQQVEAGEKVPEVCRKMGVSQATFYGWRKLVGVEPTCPNEWRTLVLKTRPGTGRN